MEKHANRPSRLRLPALLFLAACAAVPARAAPPAPAGAVVEERAFAASPSGYAIVEPVAPLVVRALADGVVESWDVVPGAVVRRGQVIGRLAGAERAQEVAAAHGAVASAEGALAAALEGQTAARQTFPVITNAQQLAEAGAAVTRARSDLAEARARWRFVRDAGVVRSPSAGAVTEVYVGGGQAVTVGAPLLAIQDPVRLWLRGVFYGDDAASLRPGELGSFIPLGDGRPVRVRVRGVVAPLRPDGGRAAGCDPVGPVEWFSGEAGTLRLEAPAVSLPAVPEEALVLRGEQWYVVVEGASGEARRKVVLGPEAAGWRAILDGLKPGERVVTEDVDLRFHRDVAKSYAPPD